MSQFLMPSLGADMEAGTLIEWLKHPGDPVVRGDIVAVVETQKGAIEIEIFEDGTLGDTLVDIGQKVPVGTPMVEVLKQGEIAEQATPKPEAKPEPEAETKFEAAAVAVAPPPKPKTRRDETRIEATPAARRLAAKKGIDLASFAKDTDAPITLSDMSKGSTKPATSQSAMRDAIATAMSRSKREIPHYYLAHVINIGPAEAFVSAANADRPPDQRLVLAALTLKATAKALSKFPEFNGHLDDGTFTQSKAIHTGMAIYMRGGGLVAPAIHDADTLTLDALMAKMRDLVDRVRAGRFRARELSDATFTVTSLGDRGVERLYGVIYPPQVAILGVGTPLDRAVMSDGEISPGRTITLTLAADHRVSDGHRGALFLRAIEKHLSKPEAL